MNEKTLEILKHLKKVKELLEQQGRQTDWQVIDVVSHNITNDEMCVTLLWENLDRETQEMFLKGKKNFYPDICGNFYEVEKDGLILKCFQYIPKSRPSAVNIENEEVPF